MPNLSLKDSMEIVSNLLLYKKQVQIEADGCEDRFYLSELQWEAIEQLLEACEGKF